MDGLSNHTYKVFSNPNTFDSIRSLASKEKRGKCPLLSLVYCSGLGFQVSANTPPMIASIPPGAVTTPKSESTPKKSITTPQLCVELGLLFIITAPIMMMIPNMRKAQTRKEERDQCTYGSPDQPAQQYQYAANQRQYESSSRFFAHIFELVVRVIAQTIYDFPIWMFAKTIVE